MPAFAFLAAAGVVLVALLFVADATLKHGPPPIVTSDRIGLPEPWHPDAIQILTTVSAPAPDMTSQAVLGAQPKSEPDLVQIESAARTARAEAPPKKKRVMRQPIDYQQNHFQQDNLVDRFSIKSQ